MSQVSIIDIEGNNPQIPTMFEADVGFAIPIGNLLEILGDVVIAGTTPVQTVASGNTVTTNVQISQAIAASNALNIGLSAFNSSQFTVDANGFVSLSGGDLAIDSIAVDAFTAPGTSPVTPNGSGIITVTGAQVSSGTIGANVIRTNSLSANTYTIQVQQSGSSLNENTTINGVSHYNSSHFTVSNGFVSLIGSEQAIDSIAVQTGTSPIIPTVAGLVTINGAVVAAGTNPIRSNGTGANTLAIEAQISQALAATDATKIGLANFNSSHFSVDANGFVSALDTVFAYTDVTFAMSPYTVLSTDDFISVNSSGGAVTLRFPNAPTTYKNWYVKDRTGNASANNITITTVGGAVTIDGSTSRILASNFSSIQLLFNSSSYEVY